MPGCVWRLLDHDPADGAWNLAVDEAVAEAVGRGEVPPTLRLYGWERPTVSLGALQRFPGGVSAGACRQHGVALVRRISGGRAVLHAAELTYSVAVPRAGDWRRPVAELFERLCGGLVAGLARLGIQAAVGEGAPARSGPPDGACFLLRQTPAIVVGGRKLVGSAQYRSDRAVLQQGSLLLDFDPALHLDLFPGWPRRDPAEGIASLRLLLGRTPPRAELTAALREGWQGCFGPVRPGGKLTAREVERAGDLVRARYGTASWTRQRLVTAGEEDPGALCDAGERRTRPNVLDTPQGVC
jgi:lipoate-protein ligase A